MSMEYCIHCGHDTPSDENGNCICGASRQFPRPMDLPPDVQPPTPEEPRDPRLVQQEAFREKILRDPTKPRVTRFRADPNETALLGGELSMFDQLLAESTKGEKKSP